MATINWDESKPAGADSLAIGDNEIRSTKTALRAGLDTEHVWPSSSGDAGVHRLGSGRPYVGVQSTVSSSGSDGRLMWTSDTSNFFHVGSGGTSLIGGASALLHGVFPGAVPQRHYWAVESGQGKTVSGSTTITFSSGYSGIPHVFITPKLTSLAADGGAAIMWVSGVGQTSFAANSRFTDGATVSTHSFFWQSIGTRAL